MLEDKEKAENDSPVWEALKAGDASVFEAIFKANYTFLYNYCTRFQDDDDEIKECIQIVFIHIWERRSFLGETTSIRNYLLASLRRLLLKRKKVQAQKVEIDSETFMLNMELSAEATLIHDQSSREDLELLQKSIEKLPERQKEALFLRFYGNQSFPEIAVVMNITTRAVYKLIYKALDALNAEISRSPRH